MQETVRESNSRVLLLFQCYDSFKFSNIGEEPYVQTISITDLEKWNSCRQQQDYLGLLLFLAMVCKI